MNEYKSKYEIIRSLRMEDYLFLEGLYLYCLYRKRSFREPIKLEDLCLPERSRISTRGCIERLVEKDLLIYSCIEKDGILFETVILKPECDIIVE